VYDDILSLAQELVPSLKDLVDSAKVTREARKERGGEGRGEGGRRERKRERRREGSGETAVEDVRECSCLFLLTWRRAGMAKRPRRKRSL
jgi:hypothetical protein